MVHGRVHDWAVAFDEKVPLTEEILDACWNDRVTSAGEGAYKNEPRTQVNVHEALTN